MTRTVLLVDDDRAMLLGLQEGLARYAPELQTHLAGDGLEALERLRREDIGIIVTDLKMPRMDGFELLAAVMRGFPDIPVLVMSAFHTADMERLALQGGALAFVPKPFLIADLAGRIQSMLRRASEGGTLNSVSPGMFLQLIEMEQKSCVIRIEDSSGERKGALFFLDGRLVDARVGDRQGEAAAYEVFTWDPVSLSIQNGCAIRERRIFKDLNALVIDAARRQDEHRAAAADPAARPATGPPPAADPLAGLRARLEQAFGDSVELRSLHTDESWDYRLKRLSQAGERLGFGRLLAAYLEKSDADGAVLLPGNPARVLPMNAKSPRDRLLQFMANEGGGPA